MWPKTNHKPCKKKKKREVVGPRHLSVSNGALKPLRGSYLQREELSRTLQPGGTLWLRLLDLSLAPAKTAAHQAE